MAIQIRRGNEANLDISQLKPGELAVCLDSGKVIVKLSGGNYLTLTDTPALRAIVEGKADASHTHAQSDITGLAEALAGKQAALTFDGTPTEGSSNPVTSGGVYEAIEKQAILFDSPNNTSSSITLNDDAINYKYIEVYASLSENGNYICCGKSMIYTQSGVGYSKVIPLIIAHGNYNSIGMTFSSSAILIKGNKLLRGTSLPEEVVSGGSYRESQTLIIGTEVRTSRIFDASTGYVIYIYRVVGYK